MRRRGKVVGPNDIPVQVWRYPGERAGCLTCAGPEEQAEL